MGFILVAVVVMGYVTYHQTQLVNDGNCAAMGGHMVQVDNELKCIKMESIINVN